MNALIFLIVFPLCIALLAVVLPPAITLRRIVGVIANDSSVRSTHLSAPVTYLDKGPAYFQLESHAINIFMLVTEVLIAAFIIYISIRAKRYLPVLLVTIQSADHADL